MATVICVGHSALDRVFTVESWPQASAKIAAKSFQEVGGGMAANAAVAVARLGGEAVFWGPAGQDAVAEIMRAQLQAEGVDATGLRCFAGRNSSTSAVLVDARGERLIVGYRGDSLQADADWLPLATLGSGAAVLADVRWPQGSLAALNAARKADAPTILDGDTAARGVLEQLTGAAEYAIFSEPGFDSFRAGGDAATGLGKALALGARFAAVTHGANGVSWASADEPGRMRHLPALPVQVIDTLAAGDVFHGAFALLLAEGKTPLDAMRFASAAAALKCMLPGGRTGCPDRAAVERFMKVADARP